MSIGYVSTWIRLYNVPYGWMIETKIRLIGEVMAMSFGDKRAAYVRVQIVLPIDNLLKSDW